MLLRTEKKLSVVLDAAIACICIGAGFLTLKYLLPAAMPFLVGMGVASGVRKLTEKILHRQTGKALRISVTVAVWLCAAAAAAFTVNILYDKVTVLLGRVISSDFRLATERIIRRILGNLPSVFPDPETVTAIVLGKLTEWATGALAAVAALLFRLPAAVAAVMTAAVSSVLLAADGKSIGDAIGSVMPEKSGDRIISVFRAVTSGLRKLLKTGGIIFCLMTILLTAGFFLLKIPDPVSTGAAVALFDLLPVFGSAMVLLPWAAISLMTGDIPFAAGLIVLTTVTETVRQITEPKLTGSSVGLHPIITLACMYTGTRFFGFYGTVFAPILALTAKTVIKTIRER